MDEYRKAQPVSDPIKLPLGLKKLRSHDNPEVIRADRSPVDHLKTHEFISSLTINMLTINHGEVYNIAMKDRPIVKMMMQNSAHILCLNEADAFLSPQRTHQDVHPIRAQGHRYQAMVIQTSCTLCPVCLPLLKGLVELSPICEIHGACLRQAMFQVLLGEPSLNNTKWNGSVWVGLKVERKQSSCPT